MRFLVAALICNEHKPRDRRCTHRQMQRDNVSFLQEVVQALLVLDREVLGRLSERPTVVVYDLHAPAQCEPPRCHCADAPQADYAKRLLLRITCQRKVVLPFQLPACDLGSRELSHGGDDQVDGRRCGRVVYCGRCMCDLAWSAMRFATTLGERVKDPKREPCVRGQ